MAIVTRFTAVAQLGRAAHRLRCLGRLAVRAPPLPDRLQEPGDDAPALGHQLRRSRPHAARVTTQQIVARTVIERAERDAGDHREHDPAGTTAA